MVHYLEYSKTPVIEIRDRETESAGIRLLVKREDLNHPTVSGNKWWKLKGNLMKAQARAYRGIVTFGGAYSNHIYATAAACSLLNIRCAGIIRGERPEELNQTLRFAMDRGMDLHFIQRTDYRTNRNDIVKEKFPDYYYVPEGGTNADAVASCSEFACSLSDLSFDTLFVPVGTGGTMAGIISGLPDSIQIYGIAVLKNGEFLTDEIRTLVPEAASKGNWNIFLDYHHGGYGKTSYELLEFIKLMLHQHQLPLDYVYTGKMMFAIYEEVKRGSFARGDTILAIHTGGLQGNQLHRFI